jgi:ubiquinone/menaquinone biosynthesis C-methylase UbiE
MSVQNSYNTWAKTYDHVENKTRDLDKQATEDTLKKLDFSHVLELGCGTGKNSQWLGENAKRVISIDFSEEMLKIAREKVQIKHLTFFQHDLTENWPVQPDYMDLITCNLTLEHIKDLNFIFQQAYNILKLGGHFFICELHPFKQYKGGKARFETKEGTHILETYMHHVSSFTGAARLNNFRIKKLNEWFDADNEGDIPRLISFVFEKV